MSISQKSRILVQKCSTCHDQCLAYTPELKYLHNQSYVTSRKAQLIDFVEREIIDWDEAGAEVIYAALNTGLQKYNCIFTEGIDEADYIREVRAQLVQKGILPPAIHALFQQLQQGSIYGEEVSGLPLIEGTGDIALVFEGASRLFTPKAREAARNVFLALEKEGAVIDVASCGYTEWDLGFVEQSNRFMAELVDLLSERGIKTVVSIDPAVVKMLKKDGSIQALHFSEFIEQKNIPTFSMFNVNVVYHDSSELARYLKITEEPRAILKRVPGVIYHEFIYHHEQAKPTGGRFGYLYQQESKRLAEERLDEARLVGANVIITASPFSYVNLKNCIGFTDLQVMDYAEFVELVVREEF